MNRTRLLGALALAVALVVGAVFGSFNNAQAAPSIVGPEIDSTAPAAVSVGASFDVTVYTSGVAANSYAGWNLGLVYDSTALTANSATELDSPGLFASHLCPIVGGTLTDNFGGLLTPPLLAVTDGCTSLAGGTTSVGDLVKVNFTAIALGVTGLHKVEFGDIGNDTLFGSYGTFTIDTGASEPQLNTYACTSVPTAPFPAGACGPVPSTPITAPDNVIAVLNNAPIIHATKAFSDASVVAGGQAFTITLTISNDAASSVAATNVSITDDLDGNIPGDIPIGNVTLPAGCTNPSAAIVTCSDAGPIAPGGSISFVLSVSGALGTAGGDVVTNCATADAANDPPPAGVTPPSATSAPSCDDLAIIPPAVAWSKVPTCGDGNVWLAENNNPAQSAGQCVGDASFDEVMTNQGDLNGLGGFSFDLHYDPTQYIAPVIDLQPAIDLFAASGRTLDCSITIPANGIVHVACASTGPIGVGPVFVGAQVMAHVTLTPQDLLVEAIRPNKENGDVSTVKDDQVTVTNTCGQPLNDGSIQPIPGQPECQGVNLQGVGPGGVLTGNPNGGQLTNTIRRLEGDITRDCSVDVSDMQLEASKFGMSVGNLLYNIFDDVNSPLQHGDGEIDINDIQFVYGRFGSECSSPIPPQPAQ